MAAEKEYWLEGSITFAMIKSAVPQA